MAIKRFLLTFVMFPLCLSLSFAQTEDILPDEEKGFFEEEQINYFIDRSGGDLRFIQRLIWEAGNYVMRYEVIIEKLEPGGYTEIERLSVDVNYAEVSLPAGQYRYSVEVYDLFDELSFITNPHEFEVIRAIQPVLNSYSPRTFYLDQDEVWEISLRGQNLTPQSVFYLVDDNRRINPINVTVEENSARLVFSMSSLFPGEYNIYVRNPGGLDAQDGKFTISYGKPIDFNFSIGYAPIMPLYGYLFKDTEIEAPFLGSFYPLGFTARMSFIPVKRIWGSLGIEASGSFSMLKREREVYTASASLLNAHLGVLYQRYFKKRTFSVNISAGAGISPLTGFFYEYEIGEPTEKISSYFPSVIAGFSFSVFLNKVFFIRAGADLIHIITPQDDSPMPGVLRPSVTAGFQL